MKIKETELGKPVVAWLESEGWDVYQEVQPHGGRVADIVATRSDILIVVELKTSLTFELLDQIVRWRSDAHQVYAVVPRAKNNDGRRMAYRVFGDHGVGVIEVDKGAIHSIDNGMSLRSCVRIAVHPTLNRKAHVASMRDSLRPEHKMFALAGSARGGHFTEFKATCDRLRGYVATCPGTTLKDAIVEVKHHYAHDSSARAHLAKLILSGVVKGIRCEKVGKKLSLYPT
jgi:hypothetical protein